MSRIVMDALMFELSKQFRFDAAHTLERVVGTETSRRIHGHSYRGEITLRGDADPATGMVVDMGLFETRIEAARLALDHHFLDEVDGLGPATLENLCRWIWAFLDPVVAGLHRVRVHRDSSGETCSYWGDGNAAATTGRPGV